MRQPVLGDGGTPDGTDWMPEPGGVRPLTALHVRKHNCMACFGKTQWSGCVCRGNEWTIPGVELSKALAIPLSVGAGSSCTLKHERVASDRHFGLCNIPWPTEVPVASVLRRVR